MVLSVIHCKSLRCHPPKSSGVIFMDRGGHECTSQNLKWESHSPCISFYFYYTHHGIPGVKETDLWRGSTGHPPTHKASHVNRLIKGITTNVSVSWYVGENFLLENRTLNTSAQAKRTFIGSYDLEVQGCSGCQPQGKRGILITLAEKS